MSNDSSIPPNSKPSNFSGAEHGYEMVFGPEKSSSKSDGGLPKENASENRTERSNEIGATGDEQPLKDSKSKSAKSKSKRSDSINTELPRETNDVQAAAGNQKTPSPIAGSSSKDDEARLIDQTKVQIRSLVQEINELAHSDCSVEEFYEGFLTRTVTALASVGGAIWMRPSPDQPIDLQYHINLKQTALNDDVEAQKQHGQLVRRLMEAGEPALVAPDSGAMDSSIGSNPTDNLLIFGPLKIDGETVGLVEIFQRAGAGPTTQRGYMRFLLQMCEIGSEYLGNQRLRSFKQQQQMWHKLEKFIQSVHQNLDVEETLFAIANEGRRLIDCDRVSVAISQGRKCQIKAVSGLDSIERRSEQVKNLGQLASAVTRTGAPLWYHGEDDNLPPQIENRLHDYIDKSHSKMLAVIPLMKRDPKTEEDETQKTRKANPIGALIVEQLKDSRIESSLENRVNVVSQHAQTALTNSIDHNSIFLMPLWKGVGKVFNQFRGQKLFRTAAILSVIGLLGAFLCLFPYPFELGAKGSLIPENRHEVYAQLDGTLEEIYVSDTGDTVVEKGQLLAKMVSRELQLAIQDLIGRRAESQQEFLICQRRTTTLTGSEAQSNELRLVQARQSVNSLTEELNLRMKDNELLEIRAREGGRVINWQVRQNLIRRPVKFGQHLMTIVEPDTQWLIELEMPERRIAHLMKAMEESKEPLKVTFGLFSHPGQEFEGTLDSVDQKLEVHSDEGNAALVRVTFPSDSIPQALRRAGTRVSAQVHCGTTSIGYAMFHELIETVSSKWKFWF